MNEPLYPKEKNILIVNLHSAQNLGDDAIMRETLRGLCTAYPGAHITLAANDPESWKKYSDVEVTGSLTTWAIYLHNQRWRARFARVPLDMIRLMFAVGFYHWRRRKYLFGSSEQHRLLSAYYEADLVLSCGGGNFMAYRPLSPFFLYGLLALWLAASLGKTIIMLPQSIGPIKGSFQTKLARWVFLKTKLIMVREMRSSSFISKDLKFLKPPVFLPDLAFGLHPASVQLPQSMNMVENRLRIGLTIMDRGAQTKSFVYQQKYENVLQALIEKLIAYSDEVSIYLFSQCYGPGIDHDDRQIVMRMYNRLKDHAGKVVVLGDFSDALEAKAAYKCMDCIIGTRMHTGIFAITESVPVILIGYQPKTYGVMESLGLERHCVDIETMDVGTLYAKVLELLENRDNVKEQTSSLLAQIQKQLEGWTRYLENV
jgi:colanic acid/amylovoran biosynthesis protein